jgi:hypothetical protein
MSVGKSTRPFEPVVRNVLHQLHDRHLPDAPVLVRYADDALGGLEGGVFDELDRHGYPVRVDRDRDFQFGRHRTADPADVESIWYVTESGARLSHLSALPNAKIVARSSPLAPREEANAVGLQRSLEAQLSAAGRADLFDGLDSSLIALRVSEVSGIDQAAAERLAQLNEKVEKSGRCRCAIVAFPARAAPPRGSEHIPEPARTD